MAGEFLYKWNWVMMNTGDVPFYNTCLVGEDTTDASQDTSERYSYAVSPKYFRSVDECIEEGIKHKPNMLSWLGQYTTLYLVIKPYAYHPIESRYIDEKERIKTFVDWPMYMRPTSEELAGAGFYYLGTADRVCCFCCGVTLRNWKLTDTAIMEHQRHAPHCLFINIHR